VTEKTYLDDHDLLLCEVMQCEFVDGIAQDALLNQQHVATTLDNGLQQIQNVLEKENKREMQTDSRDEHASSENSADDHVVLQPIAMIEHEPCAPPSASDQSAGSPVERENKNKSKGKQMRLGDETGKIH